MLFFGIKSDWVKLIIFLLLTTFAGLAIYAMYQDYYVTDPYLPEKSDRMGHNVQGAYQSYALMTFVEYLIILGVLTLSPLNRSYPVKVLLLQIPTAIWCFLMVLTGVGGGGVHSFHLLWLFSANALIFILFILALLAGGGSEKQSNKQSPD